MEGNMVEYTEETRVEDTEETRVEERVEGRTEEPDDQEEEEEEEDEEEEEEDSRLEIIQLQGLVVQLREGLHCALVELSELRQRTQSQEEGLRADLLDVQQEMSDLKTTVSAFKEELGGAVLQVREVSCSQREVQRKMELLHTHLAPKRKGSKGDLLLGEGHSSLTSQSELNVIQHYFSSLTNHSNRSTAATQTGAEAGFQRARRERNGREEAEPPGHDTNSRQRASLELLESERVYVSYLSLLLKANISFNGSEAPGPKDQRVFPSSLRFLIQQHLHLLHTLQERVLKSQWQGIMGDVFMKLTSKESDFLDLYLSYLKELPDCLALVGLLTASAHTAALLECEGDESRPSLQSLLIQPVQRIPQYTLLLQALLRQTEVDHPDYFLLLVSIQQFRSFTAQNQDLLGANRSSMKHMFTECGSLSPLSSSMIDHVAQVKRSKQRLLEQIQSRTRTPYQDYQDYQDWGRDPDRYPRDRCGPLPYFSPDPEPRTAKPTGLRSIPESHGGPCKPRPDPQPGAAGSALAQALGEFLLPGDPPEGGGVCGGDGDSLHDGSLLDRCSSGSSSSSSIDIAFVRCPRTSSAPRRALAANVPTPREAYGGSRPRASPRGCVSPDEAVLRRHSPQRPLQAGQRKSKSLNGLQLDSTVSCVDAGPDHGHRRALERQGSSKGCPTPTRRGPVHLGSSPHSLEPELHISIPQDPAAQAWGEEPRWRGGAEEISHTPLSERGRKQEKGGFRSSFKRLFKKRSAEEKKEKSETSDQDQRPGPPEAVRGTAV
ncbi:unnamed protein product [Gadus morhua 'NCC']